MGSVNLSKCLSMKDFVIAAHNRDISNQSLGSKTQIVCSNFHQVYNTAHAQLDWGLVRWGVEEEEGAGHLSSRQTNGIMNFGSEHVYLYDSSDEEYIPEEELSRGIELSLK